MERLACIIRLTNVETPLQTGHMFVLTLNMSQIDFWFALKCFILVWGSRAVICGSGVRRNLNSFLNICLWIDASNLFTPPTFGGSGQHCQCQRFILMEQGNNPYLITKKCGRFDRYCCEAISSSHVIAQVIFIIMLQFPAVFLSFH